VPGSVDGFGSQLVCLPSAEDAVKKGLLDNGVPIRGRDVGVEKPGADFHENAKQIFFLAPPVLKRSIDRLARPLGERGGQQARLLPATERKVSTRSSTRCSNEHETTGIKKAVTSKRVIGLSIEGPLVSFIKWGVKTDSIRW